MNERFFLLSQEKQQAIVNAGYQVFSQNSYKKSPVSEIASAAGISKALLFHYFKNKKELYLYLWKKSAEVTEEYLEKYGCHDESDLFEIMLRGLKAKVAIMKEYPDLSAFVMKCFYEKDEEVRTEIRELAESVSNQSLKLALAKIEPSQFVSGLDIRMMYREMYWTSEGYLWEKTQSGNTDADSMERDFTALINFWKKIYLRKEV
ncbi:MAG: TetR/AcrR family transcriptional regulator [Clostridiales bacterium]|nr:TetR/AcrR family transcriptional regulator [Clostridiales bacterium]